MNINRIGLEGAALQAIEDMWSQEYEQALEHCLHGSHCQAGERCTIGKRKQPLFMITGARLPVWGAIQETVNRRDADVEIVRVKRVNAWWGCGSKTRNS